MITLPPPLQEKKNYVSDHEHIIYGNPYSVNHLKLLKKNLMECIATV